MTSIDIPNKPTQHPLWTKAYADLHEGQVLSEGMDAYDYREDIAKQLGWKVMPAITKSQPSSLAAMPIRKTLRENLAKALTTTLSTYSAGTVPVLIPIYVDPEIVDTTRRATPLRELIPRVTNYGRTADFNQITTIAAGQVLPEDAALSERNEVYARTSKNIRYLYGVGRVTGPMFAASKQYLASGGYIDALSLEVKNKTLGLVRFEEDMMINGDATTNWTDYNSNTVVATDSYDGIKNWITTNAQALGTVAVTLANIRQSIRTARTSGGEPNLIVCDYSTYDDIKALIQDELRYVSTTTVAWGITTLSFEGIPVIASRFISTTSGSKALYTLDTNVIEQRVLQDITYEELAKTNDSTKFMLKLYETFIVKAEAFCAKITGIA